MDDRTTLEQNMAPLGQTVVYGEYTREVYFLSFEHSGIRWKISSLALHGRRGWGW